MSLSGHPFRDDCSSIIRRGGFNRHALHLIDPFRSDIPLSGHSIKSNDINLDGLGHQMTIVSQNMQLSPPTCKDLTYSSSMLLNFWAEIYIFPYSPVRSSFRYMCLRMENTDVIHKNHSTEKKGKEKYKKVYIQGRRSYLQKLRKQQKKYYCISLLFPSCYK